MECSTRWGLEVEADHKLRGHPIGSVVQIGMREFLCISQRDMVRFELSRVIDVYPFHLMSLLSIRELGIVVAVTASNPEFWVFQFDNLKNPVKTGVKVDDASVFNMAYSAKSKALITFGETIKCWNFEYSAPRRAFFDPPTVSITFKNVIVPISSSIMNPPILEQKRERLLVQDSSGALQSYSLRGTVMDTVVKLQSQQAAVGYYERSRKLLTSNSEQGVVLWNEFGTASNRYPSLGLDASLAIRFLNGEFAVLLNAKGSLTILDVKTSRVYHGYQYEKPVNRLFVFTEPYTRIIACTESGVTVLKAVLLWKFWTSMISKPILMSRCPKLNEPARMFVLCANSHVMLLSPANARPLTAITLQTTSKVVTHFYDRGIVSLPEMKRDQIMLPVQDGTMPLFSTGQNPCERISTIDMKILSVALVNYKGKPCFCFGTATGNVMFYDYENLSPKGRAVVSQYPIVRICYHRESECLLLVFRDRVMQWTMKDEKTTEQINFTPSDVYMELDEIFVFGYSDGTIKSLCLKEGVVSTHETSGLKLHDDEITGFSRGSCFFATSSMDQSVRVWSNDFILIHQVVLPLPLYSCAVLNGKRHLLVGTDSEIMFVDGKLIFGKEVDEEDARFDNYDRLRDSLDNQTTAFEDEREEEEAGETLLIAKEVEEPETTAHEVRKPKARGRYMAFAQSLRKHNELAKAITEQNKGGPAASKTATTAESNEDKKRILQEMAAITAGESTKKRSAPPPPQASPARVEKEAPNEKGQADAEEEVIEEYYEEDEYEEQSSSVGKEGKKAENGVKKNDEKGGAANLVQQKQGVATNAQKEATTTREKGQGVVDAKTKEAVPKAPGKPKSDVKEQKEGNSKTEGKMKAGAEKDKAHDKEAKDRKVKSTSDKDNTREKESKRQSLDGAHSNEKDTTKTSQTKGDKSTSSNEKDSTKTAQTKGEKSTSSNEKDTATSQSRAKGEKSASSNQKETTKTSQAESANAKSTSSSLKKDISVTEAKAGKSTSSNEKVGPSQKQQNTHSEAKTKKSGDKSSSSLKRKPKHSGTDESPKTTARSVSKSKTKAKDKENSGKRLTHKLSDGQHARSSLGPNTEAEQGESHERSNRKLSNHEQPHFRPPEHHNPPAREYHRRLPRPIREFEQRITAVQESKAHATKPIVRLARRVPTPIKRLPPIPGYSSLFARSVRPRTPPKRAGLIVNHCQAPVNVVLDVNMVRQILESNDERFAGLAAQLRPWFRSYELNNSYNISLTYSVKSPPRTDSPPTRFMDLSDPPLPPPEEESFRAVHLDIPYSELEHPEFLVHEPEIHHSPPRYSRLPPLEPSRPLAFNPHEYVSQSARLRGSRPYLGPARQRGAIVKPPLSTRSLFVRGRVLRTFYR